MGGMYVSVTRAVRGLWGWQPKHGVERKIESVLCMSQ